MKTLFTHFTKWSFFALLITLPFLAKASHNVGADLTYQCINSATNTYEITFVFYRDCAGAAGPLNVTPDFSNTGGCANPNVVLNLVAGYPVDTSQLCDPTTSSCNGGNQQGTEMYLYRGVVVLNPNCGTWTISYGTCCRSGAVTNLQNPAGAGTYVQTTLNAALAPCNSSVQFTNLPIIYTCDGQATFFNHGAYDPDGDLLQFTLVNPQDDPPAPIPFTAGLNVNSPIAVQGGTNFVFDPNTGQMNFTPAPGQGQVCIIAIRVDEIRNGVVIGTTVREVQVVVLTGCNNSAPSVDSNSVGGSALTITGSTLEMCRGNLGFFRLVIQDPDGDSLTITTNIVQAIPGALINYVIDSTVNDSVIISFQVNSVNLTPGTYPFVININDNACPVPSVQYLGYALVVYGANFTDNVYCRNDTNPVPIIVGDSAGVFNELTSNPPGLVMDSITGIINLAASAIGTYDILYVPDSNSICPSDSIQVSIVDIPDPSFTYPRSLYCRQGIDPTPIITGTPGGTFSASPGLSINPITGQIDVSASSVGQRMVFYDIVGGTCASRDTFIIDINSMTSFAASSSLYFMCPNELDTIQLNTSVVYQGTIPPTQNYNWLPNTNISNNTIPNPVVTLWTGETYVLTYNDGLCPEQRDTIEITTPYPANINPTSNVVICNGNSVQIGASVTAGPGDQTFTYAGNNTVTVEDTTVFNMNVSGVAPALINPALIASMEMCLALNVNLITHLTIYLIAPSGEQVLISQNNGGFATQLIGATFSANPANPSIANYAAPFPPLPVNGNFLPQNGVTGFNSLVGATTNGNWQLMVIHENGGLSTVNGSMVNWCLNFQDLSAATFSWDPNTNISCTVCDSPTVNPSNNTTYTVIAQNLFGCRDTSTVDVVIDSMLPTPILSCGGATPSTVTFHWVPVFGAAGYAASVNGGPVQILGANDDSLQVTGLANGACVTLVLYAQSGNSCQDGAPDSIQCCALSCPSIGSATITPSGPTTFCVGQSVDLDAGGASTAYLWSTGETTQLITVSTSGAFGVTTTDPLGCNDTATVFINVTPGPTTTIAAAGSTILCGGDSVNIDAGAGFNGYIWNTGETTQTIFANATQTYIVTISDAIGCVGVDSIIISVGTPVTGIVAPTPLSCNGMTVPDGQATVTPSGGFGGYSYLWSVGGQTAVTATDLAVGNYTVTITDNNNCTGIASVTITEPSAVTATSTGTDALCFGGSEGTATGFGTGGTGGGYTFVWNTTPAQSTATATGLALGTYIVTATDANGCTDTSHVAIGQPTAVTSSVTVTPTSCFNTIDGTATAIPSGGTAPYTYNWDNGQNGTNATANALSTGAHVVTVSDDNGCSITESFTITSPAAINFTAASTDASCFGYTDGTATINPSGGVGGFTFLWTDGQTTATAVSLAAGQHCVTASDANGCSVDTCLTIFEPAGMNNVNISAQNITCFGGTDGQLTVTLSGGIQPYNYSWSNGSTTNVALGLNATTHSVTISDANGCTVSSSASISEPSQVQTVLDVDSVLCRGGNDGQISATTSGGTAPYTYLWSNNQNGQIATGLVAGNYTVTVTDFNGCTITRGGTVSEPLSPLTASIISQQDPSCNGGTNGFMEVDAQGATPNYTYQWNSGQQTALATGIGAGNYVVTVTDANGCSTTASGNLSEPSAIMLTTQILSNYNGAAISCPGESDGSVGVTAAGGSGNYSYQWSPTGQNTAIINNIPQGTYDVTVTDIAGCSETTSITINEPTPLAATFTQVNILCHGDANGQIQVNATAGTGTLGVNGYEYKITGPGQSGNVYSSTNSYSNLAAGVYTIFVRDGNGCEWVRTVTITEPSQVLIDSVTTNDALCNGTATGTATAYASGGVGNYSYNWSHDASQTSQTATGLAIGVHSVTVSDGNGCDRVEVFNVNEPSQLTGSITANNVACIGGATTATANANGGTPINLTTYLYNWSNGQTSQTAINLTAGVHCVTITDDNACQITECVTITEPSSAVSATISSQTAALCQGTASGTATAQGVGGTSPYSYSWQTNPVQNNPTATGLFAGSYTVVVTDNNGCNAQTSVTISEPSVLQASIQSVTDASCFNTADGSATATASGGTPGYSYDWGNGQTTATATGLAQSAYIVTITDNNGCTTTVATNVDAPTAINIVGLQTTNVNCTNGQTGTAIISANGGTPGNGYNFDWSDGQSGNQATGLGAGTYTVTVTDANGCQIDTSFTITQPNQGLSGYVNTTPALCNGQPSGILTAIINGGSGSSYNYQWSNGNTNVTADSLAAGSYTVTVTDSLNCDLVLSATVTEATTVQIAATVNQQVSCPGADNGRASVTSVSGGTAPYQYLWSDPAGQTTGIATGLAAGVVSVQAIDNNGCYASTSVTITQPAALALTSQLTNVSCNGGADGSINITNSNRPIGNYTWSNGAINNPNNNLAAGNYNLTATDNIGCTATFSYTITEPTALELDIVQTSTNACYGDVNGQARVTPSGGTAGYTYQWSPQGGNQAQSGKVAAGTYTVVVTDSKGCQADTSITITQPEQLLVNGVGTQILCVGDANGRITAAASGGTVLVGNLEYSIDGQNWQQGNIFSGLTAGDYTLQVRDENGCQSDTLIEVMNADSFYISYITSDTTVEYLDSFTITAILNNTMNVTHAWTKLNNSGGLITDSLYSFTTAPAEAMQYEFTATNQYGCQVEHIVIVEVEKPRRANAATAFTPNGDGINDYFFIQGDEKIEKVVLMRVYDRWGELVYEGQDLQPNVEAEGWNGLFKSKPSGSGAYTWYAEVLFKDGQVELIRGDVVLLK